LVRPNCNISKNQALLLRRSRPLHLGVPGRSIEFVPAFRALLAGFCRGPRFQQPLPLCRPGRKLAKPCPALPEKAAVQIPRPFAIDIKLPRGRPYSRRNRPGGFSDCKKRAGFVETLRHGHVGRVGFPSPRRSMRSRLFQAWGFCWWAKPYRSRPPRGVWTIGRPVRPISREIPLWSDLAGVNLCRPAPLVIEGRRGGQTSPWGPFFCVFPVFHQKNPSN